MSNSAAIAVENKSTVLTDPQVQAAIPALQQQVSYHFKPYWNEGARLVFVPAGSVPPIGSWVLSILDDSDQAGALGYHDVTKDNTPLLKVFAKTDQENGLSWTVTASHEILEAIADPWISSAWQTSSTWRAPQRSADSKNARRLFSWRKLASTSTRLPSNKSSSALWRHSA